MLALFLAGAGHGWVAPLYMSLLLWAVLPATILIAWPLAPVRPGGRPILFLLAVIALGADAALISKTVNEADYLADYIEINGITGLLFIGIWLCLWLSWQAVVCYAFVGSYRRLDAAND